MTAASATVGAKIGKKDETWKKKKEKIAIRGEIYDSPMTSERYTAPENTPWRKRLHPMEKTATPHGVFAFAP